MKTFILHEAHSLRLRPETLCRLPVIKGQMEWNSSRLYLVFTIYHRCRYNIIWYIYFQAFQLVFSTQKLLLFQFDFGILLYRASIFRFIAGELPLQNFKVSEFYIENYPILYPLCDNVLIVVIISISFVLKICVQYQLR